VWPRPSRGPVWAQSPILRPKAPESPEIDRNRGGRREGRGGGANGSEKRRSGLPRRARWPACQAGERSRPRSDAQSRIRHASRTARQGQCPNRCPNSPRCRRLRRSPRCSTPHLLPPRTRSGPARCSLPISAMWTGRQPEIAPITPRASWDRRGNPLALPRPLPSESIATGSDDRGLDRKAGSRPAPGRRRGGGECPPRARSEYQYLHRLRQELGQMGRPPRTDTRECRSAIEQLLGSEQKVRRPQLEAVSDPPNGLERRALGCPLKLPEVGAVDIAGEGRFLLAQTALHPYLSERIAEGLGAGESHRRSLSTRGLLLHGLKYPGLKTEKASMFSSDLRLLVPIGVAALTFDGVMLRTIKVFGVTPRIPLWLAFVIALTVMTAAYLGEVAIVRRQSEGRPTGDHRPREPDRASITHWRPGPICTGNGSSDNTLRGVKAHERP
jgi:hypothetical protein